MQTDVEPLAATYSLCQRCSQDFAGFLDPRLEKDTSFSELQTTIDEFKSGCTVGCFICSRCIEWLSYDPGLLVESAATVEYSLGTVFVRNRLQQLMIALNKINARAINIQKKAERYSVLADHNDPAASLVYGRFVSRSNGKASKLKLAKIWLDDCLQTHTACDHHDGSFMPDRVIDVGQDATTTVKIIDAHELQSTKPYAVLSYCWGGDQPLKLVTTNEAEYREAVQCSILPQAIQDAITTTRALGLKYLWIDSLCIIQDSSTDKSKQIPQIFNIFRNAMVTVISAMGSVTEGFLGRADEGQTYAVKIGLEDLRTATVKLRTLTSSKRRKLAEVPVNQRAWTLEERLLSRRILYFPEVDVDEHDDLVWICEASSQANVNPPVWDSDLYVASRDELWSQALPKFIVRSTEPQIGETLEINSLAASWDVIVENYCKRDMTDPKDKLRAIAGMATAFAPWLGPEYYAGIWKGEYTARELLWVRDGAFLTDPSTYRAPSWSWAALDGSIRSNIGGIVSKLDQNFSVVDINTTLSKEGFRYGSVKGGTIILKGMLLEATVDRGSPASSNEETSGLELVVGGNRASHGLHATRFFADTVEASREEKVYCLSIAHAAMFEGRRGLALRLQSENPERFQRLGYFQSTLDSWTTPAQLRTIVIV